MSDRKKLPGKFVWFELETTDAKKAQAFYGEVLGWKVRPFPTGGDPYEMIYVGEAMIGGYAAPQGQAPTSRWIACVSVEDVDAAASAAARRGGAVLTAPFDAPGAGRMARIADPKGAELYLFRKETDDPADGPGAEGHFMWNELHTSDPAGALPFYAEVVGYAHRTMNMGPAGDYHILSQGGVDRAGVTSHLPPGAPAHWLPYVHIEDVDGAIERARRAGAEIPMPPEDIPGVGRFGIMVDPTGALLAIMRPLPREKGG
jgi:uncharacterized protein